MLGDSITCPYRGLHLTHAPFLHDETLAGDGGERPPLPSHEFKVDGEVVHSNHHIARSPTSAAMKTLFTDPVGAFEARRLLRVVDWPPRRFESPRSLAQGEQL